MVVFFHEVPLMMLFLGNKNDKDEGKCQINHSVLRPAKQE